MNSRRPTNKNAESYKKKLKTGMTIDEYKSFRKTKAEFDREAKKQEKISSMIEKECVICGNKFMDWNKGTRKTCSKECSKALKRNISANHSLYKRVLDGKIVDKDITLKKLYKRDSGVCYICGRKCSYEDRNETTCFGSYPTIEHVIPLSLGGEHSWENVRIACWDCNIKKGTDIIVCDPAPRVEHITKPSSKETMMLTKDGSFVRSFESTGQAERITGIKSKGIQKCCRGERKSYCGFVWKYA